MAGVGRPKGRKDNPCNKRKRRSESERQKQARMEKIAATRRLNNAKKKAEEQQANTTLNPPAKSFFAPRHATTSRSNTVLQESVAATSDDGDDMAATDSSLQTIPTDDFEVNNEEIDVEPALDVTLNLDIDEDETDSVYDNAEEDAANDGTLGVQQEYVKAIQLRLRDEVKENNKSTDLWLMEHLKSNEWWIRKEHAPKFAKKLGLNKTYNAYYRDVYVWLPDIRWSGCMPCCPTCLSNEQVGNNGFHTNHFGRLIVGLTENYYAISRSYCCYSCMREMKGIDSVLEQVSEANEHICVVKKVEKRQYTFMGWDSRILPLLPFGRGSEFPAFLTHRAGVDKVIVNLMRALFDKGLKPESLSNTLLELHTAEFARKSLRHEYEIKRKKMNRLGLNATEKLEPLGDFADKMKNRGLVPTGRYLMHVYKSYHATIRPHLFREVKKRDADVLILDVSYKEAKALYRYQGKPVFRGLVTGLNSNGEVRVQFHIYSDSHEQMLSALQAFEKTRAAMGFAGVTHVVGDNPRREAGLFLNAMDSIKNQQAEYDSHVEPTSKDPATGTPLYDPSVLLIKLARGAEIDRAVVAMKNEMKGSVVGLDAEWNMICNAQGYQTGRGRVQWIQIAFRHQDDKLGVLLLWVGDLKSLPNSLQTLLCDSSIQLAGNKVSGDLKYIGQDFDIDEIKATDQKKRKNVVNLGIFARVRNVVHTGNVSLQRLCELTLGKSIDKSLQTSTWTRNLTDDQRKYVAIDAAVSLEVYEALSKMKDLSCRISEADAKEGTAVDVVPSNGNPMTMASRAATGTIVTSREYVCPVGYSYQGRRRVKVGLRMYVVKINQINAPGLVLPRYRYKNEKSAVTLADVGTDACILVPIQMLMEHVERDHDNSAHKEFSGVTAPAEPLPEMPRRSERGQIPRVRHAVDGYESDDDVELEEQSDPEWEALEDEIDDAMKELTADDIELLRAAIFESKETERGKIPLRCEGLDDAPIPELVIDKYSAALGDVFHAMDRAKVPVKHESKKAYFVALREAFLVWNDTKLKELEDSMRDNGMTDDEIQAQKYHNARLYRECVDRKVPPPSILYWRVRAVYALYGKMVDSKTKKPLFSNKAWKKANNVLKDILAGYYSDPPGLNFYTKKLGKNGEVVTNKYGMEVIECFRGTNRTESFHKNLTVTFGKWNVGIEMSDCLLAERRHRHNHKCSERRRLGFPKLGHFDTWLVDQLQNLVRENHGIQLYPYWTNASDYIDTDESFDTIALHNAHLHSKLEQKSKEIGPVKLTREQQYICKAMGTSLPLLPFVNKDEKKAYCRFVLGRDQSGDYQKAAEEWIDEVDGKNVMPKLPSHLKNYAETFSRNARIKESVKKSAKGIKMLEDLNAKISPTAIAAATADDGVCNTANCFWKEPTMPDPLPEPQLNAMKKAPFVIVGGVMVGDRPIEINKQQYRRRCFVCRIEGCKGVGGRVHCPLSKKRKLDGVVVQERQRKLRQCQVCKQYGPPRVNCVSGSGNKTKCKNFHPDGRPK